MKLPVPAGTSRDALIGALVERVPADARLTQTQTFGDSPDHELTWECVT